MKSRKRIFFLHGFLGLPSDWDEIIKDLNLDHIQTELIRVDLLNDAQICPEITLEQFGKRFLERFQISEKDENYLVGYSMGGRLSLHVVQENPKLWSGALFVSTGTGLKTQAEKKDRVPADQKWAKRFLEEEFQSVLRDWNQQPIFLHGYEPAREEKNYDHGMLAQALTNWSLANQKDFTQIVGAWPMKQIWICGEGDPKYQKIYSALPKSDQIQIQIVKNASHRLLFDQPKCVSDLIQNELIQK
ncbi:MAG: putative 2-succinyl-6-hydroxy-2,4-cyclohexadiene-1-carboxylate synthase [Oligoflexia bacterium]|nr:MAG: putative 2-succinyl-6-hydroxy-2,4-cyclohexadiene-1-carboxylate synthase [Oligoflexia bacterium]